MDKVVAVVFASVEAVAVAAVVVVVVVVAAAGIVDTAVDMDHCFALVVEVVAAAVDTVPGMAEGQLEEALCTVVASVADTVVAVVSAVEA